MTDYTSRVGKLPAVAIDRNQVARQPIISVGPKPNLLESLQGATADIQSNQNISAAAVIKVSRSRDIQGFGGAAFPTEKKLAAFVERSLANAKSLPGEQADPLGGVLIINAMECDPALCSDRALLWHAADACLAAVGMLCHALRPKRCILAIEESDPELHELLHNAIARQTQEQLVAKIELDQGPAGYPSGSERQLLKRLLDINLGPGEWATEHHVLCLNIATACTLAVACAANPEALETKDSAPALQRLITLVDARNRFKPMVVDAPLGYEAETLLPGVVPPETQARFGGLFMGWNGTIADTRVDAKLAGIYIGDLIPEEPEQSEQPEPSADRRCINCGFCAPVCPVDLQPELLFHAIRNEDVEHLAELALSECLTCGACDAVCPAGLTLSDTFRSEQQAQAKTRKLRQQTKRATARYERAQARLAQRAQQAAERRTERLKRRRKNQRSESAELASTVPQAGSRDD